MVKITNGEREIEVTKGAFKDIYSRQGWFLADEYNKSDNGQPFYNNFPDFGNGGSRRTNRQYNDERYDDRTMPEYDDKDVTIPFSEMTVEELKAYAQANNIQLEQGMRKKAIIDVIVDSTR